MATSPSYIILDLDLPLTVPPHQHVIMISVLSLTGAAHSYRRKDSAA